MKLEKLSKGKFIKTSIIVLVVISIFGVIFINRSKAKYRVTQSIQVVSGEVNYTNPDFSMLGVKLQSAKGSSDYVSASNNEVPEKGYKLKPLGTGATDSYCTINGAKNNTGISISYANGSVTFSGIKEQGTRCYLFFDIRTDLLGEYTVNSTDDGCPAYEETPSITNIEKSKSLFCKGKDDFGDTYYFRGNPTNNWVKIGNFYWRIIRFNGNGSIRLIYSGSGSAQTNGTGTQLSSTSGYNFLSNNTDYVKYMYGSTDSIIKGVLDSWYNANLKSTYGSKMDGSVGFCNDADMTSSTDFRPSTRLGVSKRPMFKCETPTTNLFTTKGSAKGNQKLTNPIGLITVDEACFAGGLEGTPNSGYYLYTNSTYWTMSPDTYEGGSAIRESTVTEGGHLGSTLVNVAKGVRPVINLRSDTLFKDGGDGSSTNPYEVII